jgi:Zn finger protein HypA/HybF involved in hydrogenase expression
MHETSLVDALFDQLDALRRPMPAAADRVARVEVCIGEAAGVDPGLFEAAFEALRGPRGYSAAVLSMTTESALWRCPACAGEAGGADLPFCTACALPRTLVRGEALRLDRVELDLPVEAETPDV